MAAVLVDANILLDIMSEDERWFAWSTEALARVADRQRLVINPIVYAEIASAFPTQRRLDEVLSTDRYQRENLPWDAAFNAGRAFLAYRRAGGAKRSPLPDFYIGAHAEVRDYRLLTRDQGRYRAYFPTLKIVSPESHP